MPLFKYWGGGLPQCPLDPPLVLLSVDAAGKFGILVIGVAVEHADVNIREDFDNEPQVPVNAPRVWFLACSSPLVDCLSHPG